MTKYLLLWERSWKRDGKKGRMVVCVSHAGIIDAYFFNFNDAVAWCEAQNA